MSEQFGWRCHDGPVKVPSGVREFRVLGPIEVVTDPVGAAPALSPKHRTLLAALLVHADQVVPLDQLIDYLWGEQPPAYAVNLLRGYVSDLRKSLVLGRSERDPRPVVMTRAPGYVLRLAPGQLDLHVFEDQVERGRSALAAGDAARAATALREAMALWRGPALADVDSDALTQREGGRLQELRLTALEDRIDADLILGQHHALIAELGELVATHPMRERLRGQLMLALYRAGRPAEALAEYRSAREVLVEELGIEPGPALQRLERAILAGDPGLDVPDPTPATSAAPAQLPTNVAAFTGREEHLRQLDALLGDDVGGPPSAVVISAIAGTAGVGKTALATCWGHRVRDRFPDGQLHVNLRGYAQSAPLRPIEALAQFLRALGVAPEKVPDDVDEAASLYRSRIAGKRMLVVLDNARSVEQFRPLLPGTGESLVLVTSRDQLTGLVARDGAKRINLDVLSADEAGVLLARLLGADRVRAEPGATAELARLCAFLPLALRIAAAKLADDADTSIADYVARMRAGDRLGALTIVGDEEAGTRAAFDLSYAALPVESRRLFRLLGLVPGPDVTAEAAAALADITTAEAGDQLDRLARAHLLDRPAPGRYAFHDLLRLYAAELVRDDTTESDRTEAIARLFGYYVHGADASARLLYGHMLRLPLPLVDTRRSPVDVRDRAQAAAWLDAERSNLVAAIRHAAERGPQPAAWLLSDALRGYFLMRMETVDWLEATTAGLAAAEVGGNVQAQAAAHISFASLRWSQTRYPQAIDHYAHASNLARQANWLEGQAAALGNLGNMYRSVGRPVEAAEHMTQALALNRQTGDLGGQAANLTGLGCLYAQMGKMAQGADYLTQALAIDRKLGSGYAEASTVVDLAEACRALGRFDEARQHATRALALDREFGSRQGEAGSLMMQAALHCDLGQHHHALELAEAALAIAQELDGARIEAEGLTALATVHHHLGNDDRAVELHSRALQVARDTESRWPEAMALIGLAIAYQHSGQDELAQIHAADALGVTRRAGFRMLEGQAMTALAATYLGQGSYDDAIRDAEQALATHRETGHRLGEARTLLVLGRALSSTGRTSEAEERWREALDLFIDLGTPEADEVRAMLPGARSQS